MELELSSKMSIKFWQTTRRIIPEYSNLHGHRHYILKNHIRTFFANSCVVEGGVNPTYRFLKVVNYGVVILFHIYEERSVIM